MKDVVRVERAGDVAVIVIDNPPVNAGSLDVRRALLAHLRDVSADPALRGVVLIGAGRTFIAGSDLAEFARPLEAPELPEVIAAVERCPLPVVAALHGAALGGGFELALGCDARVASAGTVLGLPEVTLGMIPGAGGTQRLPRLVGIAASIELICSGTRVEAAQALALGMVDAVADEDLRGFAIRHVRGMDGRKRRLRDLPVPAEDAAAVQAATQAALGAGRARPQVAAAIDAIRSACDTDIDRALRAERAVFQRLRISDEAFALRHLFFAERESAKRPEFAAAARRPVHHVGVVGAGAMGSGIALAALAAGFRVTLVDRDAAALERAASRIRDRHARQAALAASADDTALADADLVIEAVPEDLELKRSLFRRLADVVRSDAILATNTSRLDIDAIAEATPHPENVVGLHFFSPVDAMRLLELVQGCYTSPEVLATCFGFARRLGKLPILAGNAPGFIGKRIHAAARRQCESMLEEGALPAEIDAATQAFGFPSEAFAAAGAAPPERGLVRRPFSATDIVRRLLLAMANEAALLLAEGVTTRIGDIDLAMVDGFGFPRWEGGPVFWACRQDPAALARELERLRAISGHGFRSGDLALLHRLMPASRLPARR